MIIKIQQINIDIFLNQILLELVDCLFLVYLNKDAAYKIFKAKI